MDTRKLNYGNPVFDTSGLDSLSDILGGLKARLKNTPIGQAVINFNNRLAGSSIGPSNEAELKNTELLSHLIGGLNPTGVGMAGSLKDISSTALPANAELARRILRILETNPNAKASLVKATVPQQMFQKYQPQLSEILGGGKINPEKVKQVLGSVDDRYNILANKFPEYYGELQQTLKTGKGQDILLLNVKEPRSLNVSERDNPFATLEEYNMDMHPQIKGDNFGDESGELEEIMNSIPSNLGGIRNNRLTLEASNNIGIDLDDLKYIVEAKAPQLAEHFHTIYNEFYNTTDISKWKDSFMDFKEKLYQTLESSKSNDSMDIWGKGGSNNIGWFRADEVNSKGRPLQDRPEEWKGTDKRYLIDEVQSDLDTWKQPQNVNEEALKQYSKDDILNYANRNASKGYEFALDQLQSTNDPYTSSQVIRSITNKFAKDNGLMIPVGPNLKDSLGPVGSAYKDWEDTMMTNLINHAVKEKVPGIFLHSPESIVAKGDAAGRIDSVNERYYDKLPKRFGFELTTDHPFNLNQTVLDYQPVDPSGFGPNAVGRSQKTPMWYLDLQDILK